MSKSDKAAVSEWIKDWSVRFNRGEVKPLRLSEREVPMTPVYSDFYIDRWADVFVRWQFNRRLGIDLIDFLEAPERYLRQVTFADEAATINRIRQQLPTAQAELLIKRTEKVHKPGVYDLTAADLKRLGITIDADSDEVVIKPIDGEIDKLVDALLKAYSNDE